MIRMNGLETSDLKKINYVKFMLDLAMAVTFVLLFNDRVLGGLTFHEMAGLGISIAFITHILLNWKWVVKVTARILDRKLPGKTRFGYLLNLSLLITMTFIIVSGILISRIVFPSIDIGDQRWFQTAHISISFLALILIGIHVGLHWHWVIQVCRSFLKRRTAGTSRIPRILAWTATVLILTYGCYQIYVTGFTQRVSSLGSVLGITSSQMPGGGERGGRFEGQRPSMDEAFAPPGGATGEPELPDFGERPAQGPGGREGGFQSPSAWGVITTYFGIMGVFVILTYYLEKAGRKRTGRLANKIESV